MADLLTLGELLIDLTQTGVGADGVRYFAANPGGAPANVAVAAARLGASAGFVGKVGADAFGADLRAALERNGVDTKSLFTAENALTTQAVVSVSPTGERSFSFYRNPGADTLLTVEEAVAAVKPAPRILHFGSLSMTADPARSATICAVELARALGSLISYDPNYRPSLWEDEKTAIGWMKALIPKVDVLKLSDEELPLLTETSDPAEGTRILADKGPQLVLLTLGSAGTFYRLGEVIGTVPSMRVPVADTNGAGDTFMGAFLRCLLLRGERPLYGLNGPAVESMLRFANCAAALTCTRPGAIPAMPTLAEVEACFR